MTTLSKTTLTTPQKVELAIEAHSSQDHHGKISELSETYGVSRPTVYSTRETVSSILTEHFDGQNIKHTIVVDNALLARAIIALRVRAPNSVRAIEDLLPILYPEIKMSYGHIWNILHEAESKAEDSNKRTDLKKIKNGALDEMFRRA